MNLELENKNVEQNTPEQYEYPLDVQPVRNKMKIGIYPILQTVIIVIALLDSISLVQSQGENWEGLLSILITIYIFPILFIINLIVIWLKNKESEKNTTKITILKLDIFLMILNVLILTLSDRGAI